MKSTISYITFMVIMVFGIVIVGPEGLKSIGMIGRNILFLISIVSMIFVAFQVNWALSIESKEQAKNTLLNSVEAIALVIVIIFSFSFYTEGGLVLWFEMIILFTITITLDIVLGTLVGNKVMELKDQNYGPGGS